MGHVRNKTKTNRRAKRTKTNKRNARKQTFRKSRRVNRGGKGPEKRSRDDEGYDNVKRIREETMEEKMIYNKENNNNNRHHQEQLEQYRKQDAENVKKELYYKTKGLYSEPLYPNANDIRVDQSTQLENINRQYKFNDLMDAADPETPTFGGKKQRAIKRK